ncbi:hypothetical protein Hanom_Chr12g01153431 [Helianthus anomalus]
MYLMGRHPSYHSPTRPTTLRASKARILHILIPFRYPRVSVHWVFSPSCTTL